MDRLPEKWRSPKHAPACKPAEEAWWYGDEKGFSVHIAREKGKGGLACLIPARMIRKWAADFPAPRSSSKGMRQGQSK